jgi:CDP-diacylglycerol--serine O-phosphatidyltransferase
MTENKPPSAPKNQADDGSPKIYLLPNLMTAGNLFCGFLATLKILHGTLAVTTAQIAAQAAGLSADLPRALDAGNHDFKTAIWCILAACIFDLLDGRLARLGGTDSAFGREFDSLADIVSFGVAPALMVSRVVLRDFEKLGWLVASLYLICGALRLARFNCIAASGAPGAGKDFKGFPIPAAAGLVASITLFMLWLNNDRFEHSLTKWVLPPLLVFLSWMMFSGFRYPSFKAINWRTTRSLPKFIAIIFVISLTVMYYQWMPAVIFITYLLYGFLRPFLSRRMKEEIEDEIEDEEEPGSPGAG